MTQLQKVIKYLAIAFAALLAVAIIGGIVTAGGVLGGILTGSTGKPAEPVDEGKPYAVEEDVRSLNLELDAANLVVRQGDRLFVDSNAKNLTVRARDGVLTVKQSRKPFRAGEGETVTLYLPADAVFEKVELQMGAGRCNIDRLSADRLDIELGAGDFQIDALYAASSAEIEGGAGKITVSDGAIANLNLEMGLGQLNFTAALTGRTEFELGIGESNITVLGSRDDYTLFLEKGLGRVELDGSGVSNLKGEGNGQNRLSVSGGIGAIHVNFKETGRF